jgi:hypothetical protein
MSAFGGCIAFQGILVFLYPKNEKNENQRSNELFGGAVSALFAGGF